ncbi:hypothetical protein QE152_g17096 [Popillia japonica]|uniref:Uncharacterized protein n=1 Tax=Popillia japonica TaxID=7064 RepID=A0AAW1L540_POPJA
MTDISSAYVNARSLISSLAALRSRIISGGFDFIAITETWLTDAISTDSVSIGGYNLIRNDRATRGGGVAFYITNTLQFDIIRTLTTIEQLWISISAGLLKIALGVVYRPPGSDLEVFLDNFECTLSDMT